MAPTELETGMPQLNLHRSLPRRLKSLEPSRHASDDDSRPENDETEARLEKLIFGDEAGFLDSLKNHDVGETLTQKLPSGNVGEGLRRDEDLENVPDEDLFFLDAGPSAATDGLNIATSFEDQIEAAPQDRTPAWVDSDDDRILVSLASNTRLRKLRNAEEEDLVNGREYITRLRRQYERLHPTPRWAKSSSTAPLTKTSRRRVSLSVESASVSDGTDSDMSIDSDLRTRHMQPLVELLQSAGSLIRNDFYSYAQGNKRGKLRAGVIDIQRTKDVSGQGLSSVDSLQFHPYHPLLLSSGPSSTIYLHHISPQPPSPNPLLTSLHIRSSPLNTTVFCPPITLPTILSSRPSTPLSPNQDTTTVYFSSRRRYFYTWSLATGIITKVPRPLYGNQARSSQRTMEAFKISPCGRYMGLIGSSRRGGGSINVLCTITKQWVCSCRVDSRGGVADFAWWRDGEGFVAVGKNGECSEYEIASRRVVARWVDEGGVGTTVIATGGTSGRDLFGGDRWVAIGSSSGIVNIYDRGEWTGKKAGDVQLIPKAPKPSRTFGQLTTPTSHLVFSGDGQMMVMASRWKRDALRMVHLPSCTVYTNWPTGKTPLGRIASVALSPNGGMLAVGNEQGKIRLWEIRD